MILEKQMNFQARRQILRIHTKEWNPKLSAPFVSELAEKTVGEFGLFHLLPDLHD